MLIRGEKSEKSLMRVLFCKIHFPPFICFCKPSSHIFTSQPLKLENTPHVHPKLASDDKKNKVIKEEIVDEKPPLAEEKRLKSNLKKPNSKEEKKKNVQWMDLLGKELVEIREFESTAIEDADYEVEDMNRSCSCVIL